MSKRAYREIIINGLIFFSMLFFNAAISTAAESADEQVGKENPFKIVEPAKIKQEQIIQSIMGTGITQAQLQAAIREAIKASGNSTPRALPVETEPVEVIPERHIKSIMLKFLRAVNVLSVVEKMLTSYGTASIDPETNTLIICDTAESLDKVIEEIAKADKTPQQILVEVVIIDVQLSNDTELGVNWDNLFQLNDTFLGSVSYVQQLNELTTGGSLTMIKGRIENTIKALQRERNTEILASPRVLVLSGQEATLKTVEEIPYTELTQTGSGGGVENPISSTKFKNAGITLTVKPTVTDEGMIMIEVHPEQSINTGVTSVAVVLLFR